MEKSSIQQIVRQSAKALGFHLAGIAPIHLTNDSDTAEQEDGQTLPELAGFAQWVAEGRAGEMEYLKRRDASWRLLRSSAQIPFPWARSVIVCAVNYNSDQPYSMDPLPADTGGNPAWIARYAWSGQFPGPDSTCADDLSSGVPQLAPTDYHNVIRDRLRRLECDLRTELGEFQARCFVDTGPLVERVYAKYAGLGWQGKNTCLINESLGSWFFLGVIVTSLEIAAAERVNPMADRCGSCTRCIDACPTDALTPYKMDASRCIAYLTIEKRGAVSEDLASKIGRNVFGCDICQEVCPWNNRGKNRDGNRAAIADWPELRPRPELVNPAVEWLAELDEESYRARFRGSPVQRAKYVDFRRNVAAVQENFAREP